MNEAPALWILTDIFALPPPMPFANVFSIGDVLIAIGVAVVDRARDDLGRCVRNLLPRYPRPRTDES